MEVMSRKSRLLFATLFVLTTACSANAYVDAGTGSMVVQVVIASTLGAVFVLKSMWKSAISFVASKFANRSVRTQPRDA